MSENEPIVDRLRDPALWNEHDYKDAADMLEFFFNQMYVSACMMDENHNWRMHLSGWPMTHCTGPSREIAVRKTIEEIKRERLSLNGFIEKGSA